MSNSLQPHEIAARWASLSITNSQSLLRLMSIESVMPSSHLILCCPLLLLPPISPSIRVFSNKSTLHIRWPKYWSFSFSIIPSKEHPGPISFRMDWLDLLVRDSQESSPTPQFKSINSSALSFLNSPTLTSIHDHWKNHSFNYMDLCRSGIAIDIWVLCKWMKGNFTEMELGGRRVLTHMPLEVNADTNNKRPFLHP